MSYPLPIRPLIIEDNFEHKDAYKKIFAEISLESPWNWMSPITPCFALSYDAAVEQLKGKIAFHIVILDLELPKKAGIPPQEGLDFGSKLLEECLDREEFPIPAILIISGHIDQTEQTKLRDKVATGCFYGKMLTKGNFANLKAEIEDACRKLIGYSAVGIHLRDSKERSFPSISPREEDLLRRSVLKLPDVIGVDLSWWSADARNGNDIESNWTKVLLGRHVLAEGHGASMPRFFKFYTSSNRLNTIKSANQIAHHLPHIKVVSDISSSERALLVTENAVGNDERPISLGEYLLGGTRKTEDIQLVVRQLVGQLKALGVATPNAYRQNDLLWKSHNANAVAEQIKRCPITDCGINLLSESYEPHLLLQEMLHEEKIIHCSTRTLVHGDLHSTNIAISLELKTPEAFLFDSASAVGPAPIEKDLASLEISILLHSVIDAEDFLSLCRGCYSDVLPNILDIAVASASTRNICEFIFDLRKEVIESLDPRLYALFLFDMAMIQVAGLAYGTSQSKVTNPYSAAMLARWSARLLTTVLAEPIDSSNTGQ